MMINSTQVFYFTLAAYVDTGLFKYLWFMIIMSIYVVIVCTNVLLLVVICRNSSLHEPMYLFLCSLFMNELCGSTGLFPFLLVQILSDSHTVSAPLCFLQIFSVYMYGGIELLNLSVMSYDRYLSICYPLQYNTRMTNKKVATLIAVIWLLIFLENCVALTQTVPLQFCGNIINKVYCDNYSVLKLVCYDTPLNNYWELVSTAIIILGPLVLIFYSYIEIFRVCFSGSKQTRQKAVSTCTPQIASMLNYCFGACFETLQSRVNINGVPNILRIFLSLYFLTCTPLFNPLMYGLNLSKIRVSCKNLISNVGS